MSQRKRELAGVIGVCVLAACGGAPPAPAASEATPKPWPTASGGEANSKSNGPTPPPAAAAPAAGPSVVTLDPRQPMPERSVSTNATLAIDQPANAGIDSRSDLYSSGLPTAAEARGGVLPAKLTLAAGGGYVTVSHVHGQIGCAGDSAYSADGGSCVSSRTELNAADHVSGIVDGERTLFLAGVFLADHPGPAPAGLDFSDNALGKSRESYAPQLGQSFFVGDGLTGTGTGTEQRFVIPEGATALYLGFADGNYFAGDPSWYSDNTGSIALQVTQKRR